jgi:peptide/nickel transport system substrate-binding protein
MRTVLGARLVALIIASMLVAAACGGSDPESGDGGTTDDTGFADVVVEDDGEPRQGGTLVYALASESDGWDPTSNRWATDGTQAALTFYDALTAYAADGSVEPFLAESLEPNADFTEWTITLRPDITFHDGTPLSAEAVKRSLDAIRTAALTRPALVLIDSIEAPDDLTVVVRMNSPWGAFPVALTGQAGVVPAPSQLDSPDPTANPIGTGPFTFVEWVPDNRLVVERNPDYWLKDEAGTQLPYLDRIEFRPVPDAASRVNGIRSGDLDMTHTVDIPAIKQFRELAAAGDLQYFQQRGNTEVSFVMLNVVTPPFDDPQARRILALATDRQAYVDVIAQGETDPADSVFRPVSPFYADTGYPDYDLDAAQTEVESYEAEKGPLRFTLKIGSTAEARQAGEFLKQMWEQAGVEVDLSQADASQVILDGVLGDYQAKIWGQFGSPDPDYEIVWWQRASISPIGQLGLNFPRHEDPRLDVAIEATRVTDDLEARKEAYREIQQIFTDNLPYIFLDYPIPTKVAQNDVRDVLQTTLPSGGESIPMGGPGSFSLVTRMTQVWLAE